MLEELFGENATTSGVIGTAVCFIVLVLAIAHGVTADRDNRQDLKVLDRETEQLIVEECAGDEHVKQCIKELKEALD